MFFQGMRYLEDKGVVHRDLAARNVLGENSCSASITQNRIWFEMPNVLEPKTFCLQLRFFLLFFFFMAEKCINRIRLKKTPEKEKMILVVEMER